MLILYNGMKEYKKLFILKKIYEYNKIVYINIIYTNEIHKFEIKHIFSPFNIHNKINKKFINMNNINLLIHFVLNKY